MTKTMNFKKYTTYAEAWIDISRMNDKASEVFGTYLAPNVNSCGNGGFKVDWLVHPAHADSINLTTLKELLSSEDIGDSGHMCHDLEEQEVVMTLNELLYWVEAQ